MIENTAEQLVQKYDLDMIETEEPILTKMKVSDITLSKRSLYGALEDIKRGNKSRTNEPISILYDANVKKFILIDGWHRFAQMLIDGKINKNSVIDIQLTSKSYNDYWAVPREDNIYKMESADSSKKKLILFHGSDNKFTDIEPNKRLRGLYMSTDISVAKDYGKYTYSYSVLPSAKILDLSDPQDFLAYIQKNNIIDDMDFDLENYILNGQLFQYDIASRTHYMDDVVRQVEYDKYDIVMSPDDLGGKGENIAYIVVNTKILQNLS